MVLPCEGHQGCFILTIFDLICVYAHPWLLQAVKKKEIHVLDSDSGHAVSLF